MKKTLQSIQKLKDVKILRPKESKQLKGGQEIIIVIDDLSG